MMRSWLIMSVAAMVVLGFVTFGVAVSSTAPDHNANLRAPESGVTNLQVGESSENKGDKSEAISRGGKRETARERRRSREAAEEEEEEE